MPKVKTHRGAAKRFKITGTGKALRRANFKNHNNGSKSPKRLRKLGKDHLVHSTDMGRLKSLIPYKF
ncbi:MAG: 50S ribosomal protein L35 [bacterium]|nr:50S ribosomal protein L35 [bacterium]